MAAEPDAAPPSAPAPPRKRRSIDATFRNGSMTVVGVLTAFSLGILMQRTEDPAPWHVSNLAVVLPMIAGIAVQLLALRRLLHPSSLSTHRYLRAIRLFLWGLGLLAAGVTLGVAQDGFNLT